jgi:hypothetical protein
MAVVGAVVIGATVALIAWWSRQMKVGKKVPLDQRDDLPFIEKRRLF